MTDTFQYDVALSFAGEDRAAAEALAQVLVDARVRVFYDKYEEATLWGKDLLQHFQTVYRDTARYCVVLVSTAYARKLWTRHELRQAQERAFRERQEYILPLRLDDTELPGMNSTVSFLDLRTMDVATVGLRVLEKLKGTASPPPTTSTHLYGYKLAEGHLAPSGALKGPLAVPPVCGASTFPCVTSIEDVGRLRRASEWFGIESEGVRESIAAAVRCQSDEIEQMWSVAIGPPLTHLLVPLIDRQLVVLKLDPDGHSFAPVELDPPFPSPGRCDTRAVAGVDLLGDGARQLLLASDGLTGSGLGQSVMAVYRLEAQRLVQIFDGELDFNMTLDFDAGIWDGRSTTFRWGVDHGPARRPRIQTSKTRSLGDLLTTKAVEYEWDGRRFYQPNKPTDDATEEAEEARFRAEADRLRRVAAGSDQNG